MKVTLKEFKKWLEQFPDDTIIRVAQQQQSRGYESYGPVNFVTPELKTISNEFNSDMGEGWEYIDWNKNRFSKSNDKTLDIGEIL